jgi:hypothetical protein
VRKLRKLKIGNVKLLDIYEAKNPLSAALDAVEEARKSRTYHRVVVKNRKRKNKKKAQRTMDRRKMLSGWNRAAERLAAHKREDIEKGSVTRHNLLKPLSPEQAGMIAENQRKLMLAKLGRRTTYMSDLTGAEFGKLLVWRRLSTEVNGVPHYLCLCACGDSAIAVPANLLIQRRKTSCRCVKEKTRKQRCWRRKKRLAACGRKRRHARKFWGMAA